MSARMEQRLREILRERREGRDVRAPVPIDDGRSPVAETITKARRGLGTDLPTTACAPLPTR